MSTRKPDPAARLRTACTGFYGRGNWYDIDTGRRATGQARPGIGWVQYLGPDAERPWLAMGWDGLNDRAMTTHHRTCAEARSAVI